MKDKELKSWLECRFETKIYKQDIDDIRDLLAVDKPTSEIPEPLEPQNADFDNYQQYLYAHDLFVGQCQLIRNQNILINYLKSK